MKNVVYKEVLEETLIQNESNINEDPISFDEMNHTYTSVKNVEYLSDFLNQSDSWIDENLLNQIEKQEPIINDDHQFNGRKFVNNCM